MRNAFSIMGHAAGEASDNTLTKLFARVRNSMERRRVERAQRRQLMRELSSMTDRDLAELGLGRGDIDRVAAGLTLH